MKNTLIISALLVFLLIVVMIFVPIIFKPQLIKMVKKEANDRIHAVLDFEGIGLNLFESFPNASLHIKQLTLVTQPPFEGDTLAHISTFKFTFNLISLIKGETVKVVSISLNEPQIHLVVLKDGTANWNVFKTSEKKKGEPVTPAKGNFNLMLKNYEIKAGTLVYDDQSSRMKIIANQLNHKGSGNLTQDHFQLLTLTKIDELSIGFTGINYLTKMMTRLKADIDVNVKDKKITLKENELQFNQLGLSLDGFVTMHGKEIITDLKFKTNQNDLESMLSLIPAIYHSSLAEIETSGKAVLQGYIQGAYRIKHYPAFQLQLSIIDGMFQYAKSPSMINHINLDLDIHNPGGIPDNTAINLKKCHIEINQEPLDVTLQVKTPISDPSFSAVIKGNINLLDIKNIIPSDKSMDLTGFVSSDLFVSGKLSSVQDKQYRGYQAHGHLSLKDINYSGPALPVKLRVNQANLEFMPEKVKLQNFQALLGKSDIVATGSLDQVLPYLLKGKTLKGDLTVNSNLLDLNPWFAGKSRQRTAIELPAGIEFTVKSTFKEVLLGKLKITDVSGKLALKDKVLHLIDLKLNVLNGFLIANGTYGTPNNMPAHSFFGLKITDLSIGEAFKNVLAVRKFVPIAKSIQGHFGGNLEIVMDMDSMLTPVFSSLSSRGSLIIQKLLIENFKPLDVAADILKMENLKRIAVENIEPAYAIRDGRLNLAPLNFKIGNTDFVVAGSNGIDLSMDYIMKLIIPARDLKTQTNAIINQFFNKKLDLLEEDRVVLDVSFKGTIDKPDVSVSGKEILKNAVDNMIDIAKQEIMKQKAILPDTVRKEIEKQKQQLEQLKKAFKKK